MEMLAKVISTNGDKARLEIRRVSACGENCGSCKGSCSSSKIYIEAENTIKAKPGQFVKIKTETSVVMKAAFLAYIFPLFMLITGIVLGSFIYKNFDMNISSEVFGLLIGVFFMVISYLIIKTIDKNYSTNEKIKNKIIQIL